MTRLVGKYVKCCRLKYDAWPSSRTYHMTERILYICGLQYVDLWINDSISNTLLALYIQSYIQDVNCSLKFEQRERGKVSVWKTTLSIDASFLIHHQSFAKKTYRFVNCCRVRKGFTRLLKFTFLLEIFFVVETSVVQTILPMPSSTCNSIYFCCDGIPFL